MKILILNGSPKMAASDTMHMTRAFLDGMNEVCENKEHIIHVINQHIKYCTGCMSCMQNGGKCVHDDDMCNILKEILQSDMLIWSFPLYCYGMPAPLKALVDRLLPLSTMQMQKVGERYEHTSEHDFSNLKFVMISGSGFPNIKNNFESAVLQFQMMFDEKNSTIITVPESPMFNVPEAESVTKPFLEVIKQAGREYARNGILSVGTIQKLSIPMIPKDIYTNIVNSKA